MNPSDKEEQLATLEEPGATIVDSSVQPDPEAQPADSGSTGTPTAQPAMPSLPRTPLKLRLKKLVSRFNVYLLAFIFILLVAAIAITLAVRQNKQSDDSRLPSQTLTPEELSRLKGTDASVGDPKQTLTIESNTVINGRVLLRDNLDVAGTIQVGGSLNLPGITVAGISNFEQIQAASLNISGDTTIQGQLNVQQNLAVSGSASFGGAISASQLNIQALQLNGDLQLNRHIDAGGGTPGRSNGNALGGGGTSSVSGSDTAGTATINTGSGPSAGCYITINFAQNYNDTPHVVITPSSSGGAGLDYYVTRSAGSFSICSINVPPAASSFSFDYIVID